MMIKKDMLIGTALGPNPGRAVEQYSHKLRQ